MSRSVGIAVIPLVLAITPLTDQPENRRLEYLREVVVELTEVLVGKFDLGKCRCGRNLNRKGRREGSIALAHRRALSNIGIPRLQLHVTDFLHGPRFVSMEKYHAGDESAMIIQDNCLLYQVATSFIPHRSYKPHFVNSFNYGQLWEGQLTGRQES
jgi:hypothetical protein